MRPKRPRRNWPLHDDGVRPTPNCDNEDDYRAPMNDSSPHLTPWERFEQKHRDEKEKP